MTIKKVNCDSFEGFVQEFRKKFEEDGNSIILAPVRSGKTYQCEEFIRRTVLEQKKVIIVFATEKNLLAESSYANIIAPFETTNQELKNNVLLFDHEKSGPAMKGLLKIFKKNSGETVAVLSSFAYFNGDQTSQLLTTIINAKKSQGYRLMFLIDEAEALMNSFYREVIIARPQDRLFKQTCKGNCLTPINSQISELLFNENHCPSDDKAVINGAFSAIPPTKQNFEYFAFTQSDKDDLSLHLDALSPTFSEFNVFRNIQRISVSNDVFVNEDNKSGKRVVCTFNSDGHVDFHESIFHTLETFYEKGNYNCFFSLLALVHNILQSSAVYIQYCVATGKNENQKNVALTYNQACEKHSKFKSVKSSTQKARASDFLNYSQIGKMYQFALVFNKNAAIMNIERHSDRTLYLSGTWNQWLLRSCYENCQTYGSLIKDIRWRRDLHTLVDLISGRQINKKDNLGEENSIVITRELSLRFSPLSKLREKAEKLGL